MGQGKFVALAVQVVAVACGQLLDVVHGKRQVGGDGAGAVLVQRDDFKQAVSGQHHVALAVHKLHAAVQAKDNIRVRVVALVFQCFGGFVQLYKGFLAFILVPIHFRHQRGVLILVGQLKRDGVFVQHKASRHRTLYKLVLAQIQLPGRGPAICAGGEGLHHAPGFGPDSAVRRHNIGDGHNVIDGAGDALHLVNRAENVAVGFIFGFTKAGQVFAQLFNGDGAFYGDILGHHFQQDGLIVAGNSKWDRLVGHRVAIGGLHFIQPVVPGRQRQGQDKGAVCRRLVLGQHGGRRVVDFLRHPFAGAVHDFEGRTGQRDGVARLGVLLDDFDFTFKHGILQNVLVDFGLRVYGDFKRLNQPVAVVCAGFHFLYPVGAVGKQGGNGVAVAVRGDGAGHFTRGNQCKGKVHAAQRGF